MLLACGLTCMHFLNLLKFSEMLQVSKTYSEKYRWTFRNILKAFWAFLSLSQNIIPRCNTSAKSFLINYFSIAPPILGFLKHDNVLDSYFTNTLLGRYLTKIGLKLLINNE